MAIATRPKPRAAHQKKRQAQHHRQNKPYLKAYWPYLPLVAIVGVGFMVNSLWNSAQVLGADTGLTPSSLLSDTNSERQTDHEASLTMNSQLTAAAQSKANDMVKRDYWSHNTPNGDTPWTFITAAGYEYQAAGENLAYGFSSSAATLNGWMHSAEHRANILDPSYTNVGFGIANSPDFNNSGPETLIVAMYAAPLTGGATVSQPTVLAASTTQKVSRLELASNTTSMSELLVGIIGSLALLLFLLRHSLAWRRTIVKGENFVLHHPIFDMILVGVATIGVLLNHTVGFIH